MKESLFSIVVLMALMAPFVPIFIFGPNNQTGPSEPSLTTVVSVVPTFSVSSNRRLVVLLPTLYHSKLGVVLQMEPS